MRRNNKNLLNSKMSGTDKVIFYAGIVVAVILTLIIGFLIYANNLEKNENENEGMINFEEIAVTKNEDETESASTKMGKTIDEVNEKSVENDKDVIDNKNEDVEGVRKDKIGEISNNENHDVSKSNGQNVEVINQKTEEVKTEKSKELVFQMPVEGEIIRGFAKDNLVYSETLEEWITHLGIDIKANKTTVVKSAEEGIIKTIKNDPRYGLTVVIEHNDKYQTVYSNLLTSEFIVEGEKIEKGQAIGTVGNTAPFEIADEPHLHFEILENNIQVDPMMYLK